MVLTGPTTRASEGGHWYDRDGTPRYEVPAKDGSMRPATLRDARKFGWYPGVTSIIKCAAAPGLETWKQNQVLMAALTLPRIEGETSEQLCARIMQDSQEQGRKARDLGTLIHAAIQGHYEGKPPSEEFWPHVKGVTESITANFGEREWISERACAHVLGYGTKADLSCDGLVLDFKGSDFDAVKAPTLKTWDEHAMQLAATRHALNLPTAECAIVYVSRTVPGLCRIIRVDEADLDSGFVMFRSLLQFWKARCGYYPELWQAKEAA
jgi:hypothetical protein